MSLEAEAVSLIERVGYDLDAGPRLLEIIADLLEAGRPLPLPVLKHHVAALRSVGDAFDPRDRLATLGRKLGLVRRKAKRPRLRVDMVVVMQLFREAESGRSQGDLAREIAKRWGVSLSTARNRIYDAEEMCPLLDRITVLHRNR